MSCKEQLSAKSPFPSPTEFQLAEHIFCIDESDSSSASEPDYRVDESITRDIINFEQEGFPLSNKSELFHQAEYRKTALLRESTAALESLSNFENLILNGSPSVATNSFFSKENRDSCRANNQPKTRMEETHPLAESCQQELASWNAEHKRDDLPSVELMDHENINHIGENFTDPPASSELLQRKKRFVIGLVSVSVIVFVITVVIIGKILTNDKFQKI